MLRSRSRKRNRRRAGRSGKVEEATEAEAREGCKSGRANRNVAGGANGHTVEDRGRRLGRPRGGKHLYESVHQWFQSQFFHGRSSPTFQFCRFRPARPWHMRPRISSCEQEEACRWPRGHGGSNRALLRCLRKADSRRQPILRELRETAAGRHRHLRSQFFGESKPSNSYSPTRDSRRNAWHSGQTSARKLQVAAVRRNSSSFVPLGAIVWISARNAQFLVPHPRRARIKRIFNWSRRRSGISRDRSRRSDSVQEYTTAHEGHATSNGGSILPMGTDPNRLRSIPSRMGDGREMGTRRLHDRQ